MPNGTPPTGHDWGERTTQSCRDHRAPAYWKSDAYEMRQKFGIPEFDPEAFEYPIVPDLLVHEKPAETTKSEGGTDALVTGERGYGKTTLARGLAVHLLDLNDEYIVWRGDSERSGWLPFKSWTTLYLPANADIEATWMDEDEEAPIAPVDDLEDEVRDVVYYEDVFDLLEQIGEGPAGTFNVVYPDPSFSGCEDVMRATDRIASVPPFTPKWEADEDNPTTPLIHWWFAFICARVESGPFHWLSLFFDEIGDLADEDTSQDAHRSYDLLKLMRSCMGEMRRRKWSLWAFGHREVNVHEKWRREFMRRIHIPDGSPNPVKEKTSTHPLGFKTVPMYRDIMSNEDTGTVLAYSQKSFEKFRHPNIPDDPEDRHRFLKIETLEPEVKPTDDEETLELEFDDAVFSEWQNAHKHRLYVNEPGSGWVCAETGEVGEELESPIEDLSFVQEPREGEQYIEVLLEDGDELLVVARIPPASKVDSGTLNGVGAGA